MLPATGLTLGELDRDAGAVDAVADRADQVLVACRLQDVVVLDHVRVRREVRVALGRSFVERLAEQEELELGRELERVARARPRARPGAAGSGAGDTSTGAAVLLVERRRTSRARSPRARGCAASSRDRAAARCRRSPGPSSRTRSRGARSSRSRRRAGSCTRGSGPGRSPCDRPSSARSPACPSGGPAGRGRRPEPCRASRLRPFRRLRRRSTCLGPWVRDYADMEIRTPRFGARSRGRLRRCSTIRSMRAPIARFLASDTPPPADRVRGRASASGSSPASR